MTRSVDGFNLLKNFAGRGKDERGLRQQVYKIYDFLQSTSNPQKWLSEFFLKGFEKYGNLVQCQLDNRVCQGIFG